MGSYTAKLNLYLPTLSDFVDVTADISNNFQILENILGGGATVTSDTLIQWTTSEAYQVASITYDGTYLTVPATATVKWPDGSAGVFTTLVINTTFWCVDSYRITHALSGKTVTQATVTRNGIGAVTVKPALVVT